MMTEFKKLMFSQECRQKIGSGVSQLARAVKCTLGPRGSNVLIQQVGKSAAITKDGVTVARSIVLRDPIENMGAQMVKQVASKTADVAGDGTSTATVLAEAIFSHGMKLVSAGNDAMSIKRGIDKAVEVVVQSLKDQSRPVDTNDDIRHVATISANGDTAVGNMIADAMAQVGNSGIITLEEGKDVETKLRVTQGFEFDRGFASPYFMTPSEVEAGRMRCVYENARVWLIKGKLSTGNQIQEMIPTLDQCRSQNTPVVVIAEDIQDVVLNTLGLNSAQGILPCVAVKAPGFGAAREEMLEDMAVLTGAIVREPAHFESVTKDVGIEELGYIKRIEVYKDRTVLIGADGREEDVQAQCDKIKGMLEQLEGIWEREQQQKRLAKLTGGVAVIAVGAPTDVAMKEKRDRIEDALAATRAAVAEGIVPGGGVALVRSLKALDAFSTGNVEEDFGVRIVREAIREPLKHIVINAGESPDVVIAKVLEGDGSYGFDARAKSFVDMFKSGIVDPTKVARVALQNASDVASLLLTTECVVSLEQEENLDQQSQPAQRRR